MPLNRLHFLFLIPALPDSTDIGLPSTLIFLRKNCFLLLSRANPHFTADIFAVRLQRKETK